MSTYMYSTADKHLRVVVAQAVEVRAVVHARLHLGVRVAVGHDGDEEVDEHELEDGAHEQEDDARAVAAHLVQELPLPQRLEVGPDEPPQPPRLDRRVGVVLRGLDHDPRGGGQQGRAEGEDEDHPHQAEGAQLRRHVAQYADELPEALVHQEELEGADPHDGDGQAVAHVRQPRQRPARAKEVRLSREEGVGGDGHHHGQQGRPQKHARVHLLSGVEEPAGEGDGRREDHPHDPVVGVLGHETQREEHHAEELELLPRGGHVLAEAAVEEHAQVERAVHHRVEVREPGEQDVRDLVEQEEGEEDDLDQRVDPRQRVLAAHDVLSEDDADEKVREEVQQEVVGGHVVALPVLLVAHPEALLAVEEEVLLLPLVVLLLLIILPRGQRPRAPPPRGVAAEDPAPAPGQQRRRDQVELGRRAEQG
mmetsp:Transcript_10005/g.28689  ORF Transcript_10005/g.28689 Transcript_10005/m.28689 type:complete len:422 (+) Transcript_10005:59-1324(+)